MQVNYSTTASVVLTNGGTLVQDMAIWCVYSQSHCECAAGLLRWSNHGAGRGRLRDANDGGRHAFHRRGCRTYRQFIQLQYLIPRRYCFLPFHQRDRAVAR